MDRLTAASQARHELAAAGIYLVPIRHHSPACAEATRSVIDAVRPAAVLIEGPLHYDALLPDLQAEETSPPVAVMTVQGAERERWSSLYPLAEFSPEWVALRAAGALGVPVGFIDLDQPNRPELTVEERGLQSERYLEQSQTIAELAASLGCRDHDELWDHLFEARERTDPGRLLDEVFTWSALARLDYEPEVLDSEGSLRREACMLAQIKAWRQRVSGPIVVVTGAFHTLPLVEELADLPDRVPLPPHEPGAAVAADDSWLLPITSKALDGLRGYSAGMPAPSYWRRVWEAARAGTPQAEVATGFILDVVAMANAEAAEQPISFASTQEAVLQAHRLAELRGHPWPARMDVVDAMTSCLVDEAISPTLRDAIATLFAEPVQGRVAPGSRTPPIVAEAREAARRLRLVIDDAARHSTTLDVARSDSARERSRFLHLVSFLGVPFATRVSGPDLVSGIGTRFLHERWDYQWGPSVESALVALMPRAATLQEAGTAALADRLDELEESIQARLSSPVTDLLIRSALCGLERQQGQLLDLLDELIEQDPALSSVLATSARLLGLLEVRGVVALQHPERVGPLLRRAIAQAAYLVPDLAAAPRDEEFAAVETVVAARRLLRDLRGVDEVDVAALESALAGLRHAGSAPGVRGAALAVAAADGIVSDADLAGELRSYFGPGSQPGAAARLLTGMLRAAPELIVHSEVLFQAADEAILTLDSEAFLDALPELRQAFTWLKPLETSKVAGKVAQLTGGDAHLVDAYVSATEVDLAHGIAIEAELGALFERHGVGEWMRA